MTTLSEIDQQIADLQRQKQKLIDDEKKSALKKVEMALNELNALGFDYRLVQGVATTSRTRRPGVRQDVLNVIKQNNGIKPADIADKLSIDDKAGKQSIANALTALKKSGEVKVENSLYTAT